MLNLNKEFTFHLHMNEKYDTANKQLWLISETQLKISWENGFRNLITNDLCIHPKWT